KTPKELVDAFEMFAPDQQVEIAAGPERGMGIERFGEDGTLERDHGDVLAPEGLEKPPKLGAQGEMTGRAFDEVTPQPLADNGRHAFRRCALRSEEHTSELQSRFDLVCRLLLEK